MYLIFRRCVWFIGDCSKCDNYAYNISVTSEEDILRNFNYTRRTHAYEEDFDNIDMVDSYDLFSISHAQLNLFRKGTKAPICVTIEETSTRGKMKITTIYVGTIHNSQLLIVLRVMFQVFIILLRSD